jgi:hypothetical protein
LRFFVLATAEIKTSTELKSTDFGRLDAALPGERWSLPGGWLF